MPKYGPVILCIFALAEYLFLLKIQSHGVLQRIPIWSQTQNTVYLEIHAVLAKIVVWWWNIENDDVFSKKNKRKETEAEKLFLTIIKIKN